MKIALASMVGVFVTMALVPSEAHALTMQECSAKYRAAKSGGALAGTSWTDFRKAECGMVETTPAVAATPSTVEKPKPVAASGNAIFPTVIDGKYSKEKPQRARMKTCVDQYNANKAGNVNGGMKWIEKGGGYYSACNKRLKSAA